MSLRRGPVTSEILALKKKNTLCPRCVTQNTGVEDSCAPPRSCLTHCEVQNQITASRAAGTPTCHLLCVRSDGLLPHFHGDWSVSGRGHHRPFSPGRILLCPALEMKHVQLSGVFSQLGLYPWVAANLKQDVQRWTLLFFFFPQFSNCSDRVSA